MKCRHCGQEIPAAIIEERELQKKERRRQSIDRLRRMGRLGRPPKLPNAKPQVEHLREQGLSIRAIAAKLGISPSTVQSCLKGFECDAPVYRTKVSRQEVLMLADDGLSHAEIARRLGCHRGTIYRIIRGTGEFVRGARGKLVYKPKYPLLEDEYEIDDHRPWLEITAKDLT